MPESAAPAVFLSYASQDAEAARRICEALRAAGVEVWFDQSELRGGDAWDRKIRTQIRDCALFMPIISANTQARLEGYFRLEWKLAEDRSHLMAKGKPFIVPVTIDATTERDAQVPDAFVAVQWTRLANGEANGEFCEQVQRLLIGESDVARVSRPVGPANTGQETRATPAVGRRLPRAAWLAACAVIVVALLVAYFPMRKPVASVAAPPPSSVLRPPSSDPKSLVVLPLENLSPDPENAFFTDGMHGEIISTLSRISDLTKVISRESALALKGTTGSLAEKAQRVNVANVITGSVRREGTRVLVALELRRARDETLLWSQRFDKQLGAGVLALQSDIAEQVARALQARERKGAFAGAQFMTPNPEAYDLFLKASQVHYAERNLEGRLKVIAGLEQALALDPNFSSAARLLAMANAQGYVVSTNPERRLLHAQEAKRWAETARRLLPGGPCDDALGAYYAQVEPNNARALALAESAVKALPNDAAVHNVLGNALREAGRSAEAAAAFRQAISLDPFNRVFRGNLFFELARLRRSSELAAAESEFVAVAGDDGARAAQSFGRFIHSGALPSDLDGNDVSWLQTGRRDAEALAHIETALAGTNVGQLSRWRLWIQKCDSLRRLRREADLAQATQEAKHWLEKLNALPALDPSERDGRLAETLARLGQTEEAIAAGRRHVAARSPDNQVRGRWEREIGLAKVYAGLAHPRECIELLTKLLLVPSGLTVPLLKADPTWDHVRDDPAFKALLADPKNSAPL